MTSYLSLAATWAVGATGILAAGEMAPELSVLGEYGVLGVFTALLLWFARTTVVRETTRADRLEAEVLRLNNLIAEKVVPALVEATNAMNAQAEYLRRDLRRR